MQTPVAYHLIAREAWAAAPADEPLRVASLDDEGFVHLTHRMADLVDVANSLYRAEARPHVVLTVALRHLTAPWRYDGDDRYPHVYGPIDRAAITEVRAIERAPDGTFLPIERPDRRRRPDVAALVGGLLDAGVEFVVVGSAGAALLGADLVPGDLDISAAPDEPNLERLGAFLLAVGARPRVDVPGWVSDEEAAAWQPGVSPESLDLLFETRLGDLDVMFSSLGADGRSTVGYHELRAAAVDVAVGGRNVAVARAEHLVASKLAARRPKDLRAKRELERLIAEARG